MALRPGRCFREIERPYTRISYRVKNKNYIPGAPQPRIRHFDMGNVKGDFPVNVYLVSLDDVQVRDNALEAARIAIHKYLDKKVGAVNYHFKVLKYPHHVLREHPIAMGAGADRYSQGMRLAFGRPIGRAVQLFKQERLVVVRTQPQFIPLVKEAFKIGASKLPFRAKIVVEEKK